MHLLMGLVFSHVSLEGFLIKLKLDDNIFFIENVGLGSVSPFIGKVLEVSELCGIVINNEILEAGWNITSRNPYTARSTSFGLNQLLLFFFIGGLLFLLLSIISCMNVKTKLASAIFTFLWR